MVRTRRGLTERHKKIIEYLNERMSTGYPPSIREIGEAELGNGPTTPLPPVVRPLRRGGKKVIRKLD